MRLLRRLRYLLNQRQSERDLAEELEFHRALTQDSRQMGNLMLAREDARAVWIWPWLQSVWQDVSYALRSLRRQPGFTVVALLALGTAIGLNTSFFTVFNAVALRPWPVKDPSRVVKIFRTDPRRGESGGIGVAEYRYLSEHARAFDGIALMRDETVHFGFEAFGKGSFAALVSANYFGMLGVGMQLGRGFLPEEDREPSPAPVIILGYPYWRDHFGSDAAMVGKQIRIDELSFTVVGVLPENFTGASQSSARHNVYFPLSALLLLHPTDAWAKDTLLKPDYCCSTAMARLSSGVSRTRGAKELTVLERQFRVKFAMPGEPGFVLTGTALLDNPGQQAGPPLALIFVGVMLVVLLACANVGNLLIARAGARRAEIEIRRAIGAGRARIVRQLMTESLLLGFGAAAIGLLISFRLPLFIIDQVGEAPPFSLNPDGTVLAYALALSVFACLCFGLAPALQGTRFYKTPSSRSRMPLRSLLMAAQVALSVLLLTGAGLAVQGVVQLRSQDPGFQIAGVSAVSFELPARSYDAAHTRDFYQQLRAALEKSFEGRTFGLTAREPLSNSFSQTDFRLSEQPATAVSRVEYHEITAGFFDVLHIPVIAGHNFAAEDAGRNVVLVNESLARHYWNGELPVGQTIVSGGLTREIVGVVKDAHTDDLARVYPTLYVPFSGRGIPKVLIAPEAAPAVAAAAQHIEPRVRVRTVPLQDNFDRWFSGVRVGAEIAGMLGGFALILATVGMAGVFAYAVQQRTKEIGIRTALGARPAQVVWLVLKGSSRAIVAGFAAGLVIALGGSRLMLSLVGGATSPHPSVYLTVALILVVAGIAASYLPARRAARLDPLQALRHD